MTVSKQIIEVLDALCEKFGIAIDWASENVLPQLKDLCGRFMKYQITKNSIGIFSGVLFLAVSIVLIVKPTKAYISAFKQKRKEHLLGLLGLCR